MIKPILSRFIFACSLCIVMFSARAQYVAIPDSNFGNWLHNNGYSSCLTGNSVNGYRLDTTCSALTTDTVNCGYSNIYNLTGIQYFHNLTYLDCGENHLSSLSPIARFSATLTTLICQNNPLGSLPTLPTSLSYLACDSNQLTSLPTLPISLTNLYCDSNYLTSLPALPSSISDLECDYNQLTGLPTLPSSLYILSCNYNQITSLPTLPASLTRLTCFYNKVTNLPTLPASLKYIDCTSNLLTSLPPIPANLVTLVCSINSLTAIPTIGDSIRDLYCSQNLLTSLPTMPPILQNLECNYNQLTSLPTLPISLSTFDCASNLLASLPSLPSNLYLLSCQYNQLTSLPALPAGLYLLDCGSNNLSSLPDLPSSLGTLGCSNNPSLSCLPRVYQQVLYDFYISGTAITCVPNNFTAQYYDINPATMPLCSPVSGCPFYYNIAGNVHFDTMGTCVLDSLQPGKRLSGVKVQLKQGGEVVQQTYTLATGEYSFKTDSLTGYTVDIDTSGQFILVACPSSGSRYVLLSPSDSVMVNEDFGMVCNSADSTDFGILSISASSVHPFRTSLPLTTVYISAGSLSLLMYNADCNGSMSGTVTTTYSGSVKYAGPGYGALTPSSISGNTLTYNIADLSILQPGSFDIAFTTDTDAVIGSSVCITVILAPFAPGLSPDTLTQCFVVHDPHDPNYKEVYPTTLPPDGGWLTYMVRFQNTGNDTAYTVVVRDTLSLYIDASTFQYLASSNKVGVQLFGNAMVFTFPKINLVDSATNDSMSIGWIQYKAKSKPNLPLNTQIDNTAFIYFDQNPAVITNTAVTNVYPAGIRPILADNIIHLYPNPNKGTFTLQTSNSINSKYTITDMLGHVITEQTITAERQAIDVKGLVDGVYILTVKGISLRFTVFHFE